MNDTVGYSDIDARDVKAISIEREKSGRISVNYSVAHVEVVPFQLYISRNGLPSFEIGHRAVDSFEAHGTRTRIYACAIVRICIPPCLTIEVDSAVFDIGGADIVNMKTGYQAHLHPVTMHTRAPPMDEQGHMPDKLALTRILPSPSW